MKALSKIAVSVVTTIMILSSNMTAVYANGGPPHLVTDGDVEFLLPVKHSDVEIQSERLLYTLNDFMGETMTADVAATYEMLNTSEETATIGVWEPTFQEIMFYFSTGGISADFDPSGNYVLNVSLFNITFAAREVCELTVAYTETAAFITDNFNYNGGAGHNPRFQFYYLLEPARYWKDFRNLSISVRLPRSLKTDLSLDGFTLDEDSNMYTASFDGLPSQNLEIVVYKNSKVDVPNRISSIEKLLISVVVFIVLVLIVVGVVIAKIIPNSRKVGQ